MQPISEGFFGKTIPQNLSRKSRECAKASIDSISDFTRYFEKGLNLFKKSTFERTPKQDEFWNEFIDSSIITTKPKKVDNSDFFIDNII